MTIKIAHDTAFASTEMLQIVRWHRLRHEQYNANDRHLAKKMAKAIVKSQLGPTMGASLAGADPGDELEAAFYS